jgi:hypothetical protein
VAGKISTIAHSTALVTTSEDLADPMLPSLEKAYCADETRFVHVGPLIDKKGSTRAGFDAFQDRKTTEADNLVQKVHAARMAGRKVVLVSMGTVITSEDLSLGWNGRLSGADGKPHGLTGRQLAQNAWAGAFDAFGANQEDDGALLVVSVGKRPDALEGIQIPPNALCLPNVPQVDVLQAGVDVFLTHGGQNSFSESMLQAVPLVVCPGFGDQKVNSRKAVELGVGLKVDRPEPNEGGEEDAAAIYRKDVCTALLQVTADQSFATNALRCQERLERSGGVLRAVETILAEAGATMPSDAANAGA